MRHHVRPLLAAVLVSCLVPSGALPAAHATGDSARYTSGGAVVVRRGNQTYADDGAVRCDAGTRTGAGGFCLEFGGGDAIHVVDDAAGEDVPFQVCVDNNGDGLCTSPEAGPCADDISFSHDDDGAFYNPLGPLPTGFRSGCPGGTWAGYVVFLCQGTHDPGTSPHTHSARSGTGTVTTGGEGNGTFCGGTGTRPSRKAYSVRVPVPNYQGRCRMGGYVDDSPGAVTGRERFTGTVLVQVTALDGSAPDPVAPVTAVSCGLAVNGGPPVTVLTASDGTGSTAYAAKYEDAAWDPDDVHQICTTVRVYDRDFFRCDPVEHTSFPDPVEEAAYGTIELLGPVLCAVLPHAAGSYGPVTVSPDGELSVNDDRLGDCP